MATQLFGGVTASATTTQQQALSAILKLVSSVFNSQNHFNHVWKARVTLSSELVSYWQSQAAMVRLGWYKRNTLMEMSTHNLKVLFTVTILSFRNTLKNWPNYHWATPLLVVKFNSCRSPTSWYWCPLLPRPFIVHTSNWCENNLSFIWFLIFLPFDFLEIRCRDFFTGWVLVLWFPLSLNQKKSRITLTRDEQGAEEDTANQQHRDILTYLEHFPTSASGSMELPNGIFFCPNFVLAHCDYNVLVKRW